MKIYTRSGDKGRTSLIGGRRVSKTHYRLEAYGTVDELNAHLGLLVAQLPASSAQLSTLQQIQNTLFVLGAQLATPSDVPTTTAITPAMVQGLEAAIDDIDARLPQLRAFVLPGGCLPSAQCHVCRTVCRRAERNAVAAAAEYTIDTNAMIYINRLSDYLYALGRVLCDKMGKSEFIWEP